ncbi:hypothetical protein [Tsukamurella ocularis]|uniref:hypothetical protein n=1 Tax=Tsukamurella ocularis TaxID=1970234 RepID=UPI0021675DE0|nr:hypothetical protein [Tsukamurella ocularis]MCS3781813.1 Mce-associated membrane protein [Tsukamurella ocularis]MCS3788307.1 Mce-associated membrane protein [Tsukamurella ocularis]MCS3852027.1 Mce-associated membrane protein [Tsukamurella ocularis]
MTQPAARKPLALALGLLAVAMIVAVVVGVNWWGRHTAHERAAARDAAVDGARQAVIDIQKIDTKDVDGTLRRMGEAMTGDLRKDWDERERVSTEDMLKQYTGVALQTDPVVASAAPIEFDDAGGAAKVLVYLVVRQSENGKQADNAYRWTYVMSMTRVDGTWKASGMQPLQERAAIGPADPSKPATGAAPEATTGASPAPATPAPPTAAPAPEPSEGGTP